MCARGWFFSNGCCLLRKVGQAGGSRGRPLAPLCAQHTPQLGRPPRPATHLLRPPGPALAPLQATPASPSAASCPSCRSGCRCGGAAAAGGPGAGACGTNLAPTLADNSHSIHLTAIVSQRPAPPRPRPAAGAGAVPAHAAQQPLWAEGPGDAVPAAVPRPDRQPRRAGGANLWLYGSGWGGRCAGAPAPRAAPPAGGARLPLPLPLLRCCRPMQPSPPHCRRRFSLTLRDFPTRTIYPAPPLPCHCPPITAGHLPGAVQDHRRRAPLPGRPRLPGGAGQRSRAGALFRGLFSGGSFSRDCGLAATRHRCGRGIGRPAAHAMPAALPWVAPPCGCASCQPPAPTCPPLPLPRLARFFP